MCLSISVVAKRKESATGLGRANSAHKSVSKQPVAFHNSTTIMKARGPGAIPIDISNYLNFTCPKCGSGENISVGVIVGAKLLPTGYIIEDDGPLQKSRYVHQRFGSRKRGFLRESS